MLIPLFDLDGTLVDSGPPIMASANHALESLGFDSLAPDQARSVVGPPLHVSFSAVTGLDPEHKTIGELIGAYRIHYADTSANLTTVYSGIADLLDELGSKTKIGVVTSKPKPIAERVLNGVGLRHHFDFVEGPALDSPEPKAETLARGLEAVGHQPAVMIGDRSYDIVAAVHHEIASIGITWGYGDAAELTLAGADQLATSPAALGQLLLDS